MNEQPANTVSMPIVKRNTASITPSVRISEATWTKLKAGTSIAMPSPRFVEFTEQHVQRESYQIEDDAHDRGSDRIAALLTRQY